LNVPERRLDGARSICDWGVELVRLEKAGGSKWPELLATVPRPTAVPGGVRHHADVSEHPRLLDLSRDEDRHMDSRLHSERFIWLTTVRPDSVPQSVPVWFLWDDPLVTVFSGARTRKARSISVNPGVWLALNAADGGNDIVMMEGTAELLDDSSTSAASTPEFVAKYETALGAQTIEQWSDAFPLPIRIVVHRIVGWTKPGGQLRYRAVRA
jgi:PPOX class probable F420-dependent enzyme